MIIGMTQFPALALQDFMIVEFIYVHLAHINVPHVMLVAAV